MKLIVGLGNPGPQYSLTRHNLGFLVLEALGKKYRASFRRSSAPRGEVADIILNGVKCSLLMPLTFMNHSGAAVKSLAAKKGAGPQNVLVVCDDLSLPFGKLRLRLSGSAGGHNGLKSIIEAMGSKEFARLRMGIDAAQDDPVDYVLGNFTAEQKKNLPPFINHALDCVTCWVAEGAEVAMNRYN